MDIKTLSRGTNKLISELQKKHGDKPIKLDDIAPEDRELVGKAVGGKSAFTVHEIAAGLVDAFDAIKKEDGRGFFRAGKNDGVVQPEELAKAAQRNPASSPLYTRIAARVARAGELKEELKAALTEERRVRNAVLTGPEYVKVLADAYAPYKDMPLREAYESALKRYAKTGAEDVAVELKKAWAPLEGALRELKDATTAYTDEDKAARSAALRDAIQAAKDQIPGLLEGSKKMAAEYGPTYIHHNDFLIREHHSDIAKNERLLEETQTRPSIPAAERDARQAAAQKKVDELGANMRFVIEDYGIGLLELRPDVMDEAAVQKMRGAAEQRLATVEAELLKTRID